MSTGKSAAGQVISETARQEGGPYKGSDAAQMQSQVTKQQVGFTYSHFALSHSLGMSLTIT